MEYIEREESTKLHSLGGQIKLYHPLKSGLEK